ncbi:MAG: periplasmic heavy metal sensor [Paracoccaceae bacterium]|nr:periplasmic heavy metal sensor [Paracoccaceae bacterium]
MSDLNDKGARRMSGWVRVVFFASLALNLLVAGLVIGLIWSGGPPRGEVLNGRDGVTPYTRAFDEEQRRAIRQALRRSLAESWRENRQGLAGPYREALVLLRADPFDAAAMAAVLERQVKFSDARRQRGQEVLTGFLSELSLAERQAYANRLEAEIERLERRRPGRPPKE